LITAPGLLQTLSVLQILVLAMLGGFVTAGALF
jgi:hypothetical protein